MGDAIFDVDDDYVDELENKYLSFQLGSESYALEIRDISEIIELHEITDIPDLPSHVKGVINRRGNIIPVIDMRTRLGLPQREYDKRTCIIVVNSRAMKLGLIVDRVNDSYVLTPEQISEPPGFSKSKEDNWYIAGIANLNERMEILVDLDRVLHR